MFKKKAAKFCGKCGEATVKAEREACKHCGSSEWVSADEVDKVAGDSDTETSLKSSVIK